MPGQSGKSTTVKSDRLELAMVISNITSKQDAFVKAVEKMDDFQIIGQQKIDSMTSL